MAEESYPEDLRYHPEHDWARIEGDSATFGLTWYAQDALGEVVFYEPPEVGKQVTKDEAYAEVESVKAVSDVYAPLSGEVTEVNAALAEPREDQRGPLRRWLDGQGEALGPLRGGPADGRGGLQEAARGIGLAGTRRRGAVGPPDYDGWYVSRYTSATDDDRRAMLDAIGVGSTEELFEDIPEALRLGHPPDLPDGKPETEVYDRLSALAARNVHAEAETSFLGAGMYDHYVPAIVDAITSRSEFLTPYTPYQAEISQGGLQVMFEFQTAMSELTGLPVSNAAILRGAPRSAVWNSNITWRPPCEISGW